MKDALAIRPDLERIAAKRAEALAAFGDMEKAIARITALMGEAAPAGYFSMSSCVAGYGFYPPSAKDFRAAMDEAIWRHLGQASRINVLMDANAKAEFQKGLRSAPEATLENMRATLEGLEADRGAMFRRSVVAVFKQLPHDYRTNNAFRFGEKMIFDRMVELRFRAIDWSLWSDRGIIVDLERALCVVAGRSLDGIESGRTPFICAIEAAFQKGESSASAGPLSAKWFKKGTMHVAITDEALVRDLNRILAEETGAALAHDRHAGKAA